MYLHICLWMCMDSAHRKMDRISFQPLHWDNRQAATGRFFFPISLPFFHIYRDQTRDRWGGGKPIDDPLPQHNSSSLIILHFFFYVYSECLMDVSQLWFDYYYSELFSAEREISVHSLLTFFFFYLFCGYLQSINCGPFHLTSYPATSVTDRQLLRSIGTY
jgi:hypothetical protein